MSDQTTEQARDRKVSLSSQVLIQEVSGEAVVFDLASGRYFGLDEIGARILKLLAEYGDVGRICQALLDEYEVDEDRLFQDVTGLIAKLAERGLISVETPPKT